MLTKKDRKILNQKSMIHNRGILIKDMEERNIVYEENGILKLRQYFG